MIDNVVLAVLSAGIAGCLWAGWCNEMTHREMTRLTKLASKLNVEDIANRRFDRLYRYDEIPEYLDCFWRRVFFRTTVDLYPDWAVCDVNQCKAGG